MSNILLIEDEQNLADIVTLNLQLEDFTVKHIANGKDAMSEIANINNYSLVLLDVMLPDFSGWDICEAIRKVSNIPVLFMSAKGNSEDKIKGLKLGADDYLAKPFDLEELLLRVSILNKRNTNIVSKNEDLLQIQHFTIDFNTYEILKNEVSIQKLSKREVELLKLFAANKTKVVSRDMILDKLWGEDQFPSPRTIDNYILGFRKIFEENPKNPIHFLSIRGVGYKFMP